MAAIALREYVREIEKQVDGGRNDEAIAHSRHVLETFPKHVEVYRLLGKAYLESQRYGDAGDIFQRVLSTVPEDFVAHVGMSIIREDEGNFDEAIWHMERAFDVQPSNSAIQEELRRLYGRRDNVEPPKIRLTRGALARMYYKGELFPQAIAELRAALSESPDRLDLQVLLAEVYARSGQRVEAVDLAGQVLRKLPFCLSANQIMVDMLKGTERGNEIETYTQRLNQLDPYAAYVTNATPRSENVPDQAVRLTKLDYVASKASQESSGQPLWAATLGIAAADMATGREETPPEWLTAGSTPIEETSEPAENGTEPAIAEKVGGPAASEQVALPPATTEEEQIPEWMKDMGWGPASEESRAAEAAIQFDEGHGEPDTSTEPAEGELVAAEIPEWLKAMAPPETRTEAEGGQGEEDVTPWLEQLFSTEGKLGESGNLEELTSEKDETSSLGWLALGAAAGAAILGQDDHVGEEALTPGEAPADELGETFPEEAIPAWLLASQEEPSAGEKAVEPALDWLDETDLTAEMAEAGGIEELPDWLRESLAPAGEPGAELAQPGEQPAALTYDDITQGEETTLEKATAEPATELPEWLFESGAEQGEEATAEAGAENAEALPGWLFESEAGTELAAELPEDLPDWLFEETPGEVDKEAAVEGADEGQQIPDWLKAAGVAVGGIAAYEASEWVSEEKELEEEAVLTPAEMEGEPTEALLAEELPEWLREPEEVAEPAEVETDQDILAAVGAALVAEVSTLEAPEEQPDKATLPAIEAVEVGDTQPTLVKAAEPAPEINPELEEAFAWLDMMLTPVEEVEKTPVTEETLPAPVEAELPVAVEPPGEAAPVEAVSGEAAPGESVSLDDDAAFAWMESLAVRQGADEALLLKPEERLETPPDWVQQAAQEAGETAVVEEAQAIDEAVAEETSAEIETEAAVETPQTPTEMPVDEDAAFAWMESLAVRQGASEALLLTPEERRETPPDWLVAVAAAGAAAAAIEKASEEPEQAIEEQTEEAFEPVDRIGAAAATEEIAIVGEAIEPGEMPAIEEVAGAEEAIAPFDAEALETGFAGETLALEPQAAEMEAPPDLPDWLAASGAEAQEETLEWTPPPVARHKYDLNKITLAELERLPGVGFIMAQRVIDYRNTHGPFKQVDDLVDVPDFNQATLDGIQDFVFIEARPEPVPASARIPTQPRPVTDQLLAAGIDLPEEMQQARKYLDGGQLEQALGVYGELIHSKKHLAWVIEDLSQASEQFPADFSIWQNMGDAYVRTDQTSQALQAYIQAEKLLLQ
jgi:competence ComEA-like helix-hairpin-helix protein